ncbi:MAG: heavy metal sensor histidine kinase [Betaproteobacteria bacterium]|nr:heavy metal sensor histidine kinase [Betaproteobacteria bacterium]
MSARLSLHARVSLLFAALATVVLLAAGLFFEHAAKRHFLEDDRQELDGKMALLCQSLKTLHPESSMALAAQIHDIKAGHPGMVIVIRTSNWKLLSLVGNRRLGLRLLEGVELGDPSPALVPYAGHFYRVLERRVTIDRAHALSARVIMALDISDDQQFLSKFLPTLWFGIATTVLVMGVLGGLAVRSGLSPLHKLSEKVAGISAQELGTPLSLEDVPRDLKDLVGAFNRMLGRLDRSFQRLSEYASDIAHELRTPLNNLMMQIEVTLAQERDAQEYLATLQSNLEECGRLSHMTSDMLFLAKVDQRMCRPKAECIDLAAEVERLFDFYDALAADHGVRLQQSGAATAFGDGLMISRALSNLLSNAIRFTPKGMAVLLTLKDHPNEVRIEVINPGPEIPADVLPRIFDRLYHREPDTRGNSDNIGLGLAITKAIVELHGGTLCATSTKGETRFTISLPKAIPSSS